MLFTTSTSPLVRRWWYIGASFGLALQLLLMWSGALSATTTTVTSTAVASTISAQTHSPRMGFWAALIPIIASAISAYGANRAAKSASKRTSNEKQLEQQMLEDSKYASAYGKSLLEDSRGPMMSAENFWNAVLNGDRESLMSLFGNEINDLGEQSRTAYQTGQQLMPRSGISAEYLSSLPFQRAVQERRILSAAKPQAANQLATLATNRASIGMSGLAHGSNSAGQVLDYGQMRRGVANESSANTAAAIYSLIMGLTSSGGKKTGSNEALSWWNTGTGRGSGGTQNQPDWNSILSNTAGWSGGI